MDGILLVARINAGLGYRCTRQVAQARRSHVRSYPQKLVTENLSSCQKNLELVSVQDRHVEGTWRARGGHVSTVRLRVHRHQTCC